MSYTIKSPKKLIEVAMPLDDINAAAAKEKSIRHGHPSTLHLWWARRPLAAARAVIFGQLVNDPASLWEIQNPGQKPSPQQRGGFTQRRTHLFELISDLVKWESTTDEEILKRARAEIRQSWREVCALNADHPDAATLFDPEKMPGLHDPFAGGGTIPLEAQRLGLDAYASDLNPVAVLINKAMIEIPPKFAGRPPVNPHARREAQLQTWKGAQGLAEDVRRYGAWMLEEAEGRIGHLYPKVRVTAEMVAERPDLSAVVGEELTVVAWLWARTVKSPNPAFSHVNVPLAANFVVGCKTGREAWVQPVVEGDTYRFVVRTGKPPPGAEEGTKAPGRGANFRCVVSGAAIGGDYVKMEGQAGRLGARLMAVVAEGSQGRLYLSPTELDERVAAKASPGWRPSGDIPARLTGGTCVPYGLRQWEDIFTSRQLVALSTFCDLVIEVRTVAERDAIAAGMLDDGVGLEHGGRGARAYGEAVAAALAMLPSRIADRSCTICTWDTRDGQGRESGIRNVFARQAIPMSWDFAEANVFSGIAASFESAVGRVADVLLRLPGSGGSPGSASQLDAQR